MRTAKTFLARMAYFLHQSSVIQDELDDAMHIPPPLPPDPRIVPTTIKGLFPDRYHITEEERADLYARYTRLHNVDERYPSPDNPGND